MNVLVTGSNGYIGKSIINSGIKDIIFFHGTRQTIDLYNKDSIKEFIKSNNIDSIIHCAIEGGHRLNKDDANVFYNNMLIFENLYSCKNLIHKLINLASGAEFDRQRDINLSIEEDIFNCVPKDYYGLSKNIISKRSLSVKNFYNLRLFGCFDENEIETRFIKSSIIKSKKNESIIINSDKKMDFFYLRDLIRIVDYFLFCNPSYQDINLSYKNKYKLSEIAKNIINLNNSKSQIIIENENGLNYNGNFNKILELPIKLEGFEIGMKKTIIKIK
jgi:nucleoside-diphosphate-sugar epimerase